MATATTTRPERYTKAQYLRDVAKVYQRFHPGPFSTADVATWAIARGLYPVPADDEERRQKLARVHDPMLSTTTPAGIRAHDPDAQAAALQSKIDAWRADWLRFLLAMHARDDYRLALRLLLSGLADGSIEVPQIASATIQAISNGADLNDAIARIPNPVEPLMEMGIDQVWFQDEPNRRALSDAQIEAHARAAGIYLAAHWKADLAGPLTARFFELLPLDQLHAYAKQVRLVFHPKGDSRTAIAAALIQHKSTRNQLPACIRPVALDPPKKGRAK